MGSLMAQTLSPSTFYAWPTWSPDGTKLAASMVRASGDRTAEVSVHILEATTGRTSAAYENEVPALIADGVPHYFYWSPDSQSLAFIASTPQGLTLFVADSDVERQTGGQPLALDRGAPLYFSWAKDGSSLALHSGPDVKLVQRPFDSFLTRQIASTGGFRAPAFSPDGKWLAYMVVGNTGSALFVAEAADPSNAHRISEAGIFAAFMWSPDGTRLAVAEQSDPGAFVFEGLRVLFLDFGSTEGPKVGSEVNIAQEPLLAFYWSPDADKIAWVSVDAGERMFEWKIASSGGSEGDSVRRLLRFQPSNDVFTMFTFFDQYAYSHSPWSPDGTHLVVAGSLDSAIGGSDGQSPSGSRIYVLDTSGVEPPRDIGPGILAFWSWN